MTYGDGPCQGGMYPGATTLTGMSPHFSLVGIREMVVIAVLYKDQTGNRSRQYTEYVCRDIQTGEKVHARRIGELGDPNNGDDNIIHPAKNLLPGAKPQKLNNNTPAKSTDGSRVLVGFVEGSHNRAVILGVFPHASQTFGALEVDGERRLTKHMGTTVEIKKDGQWVITHKTGATMRITDAGDIVSTPAPGRDLFHGNEGASENHVLGQKFKTMMETLIDALLQATYPTGTGPSGTMLPPSAVTLNQIKAQLDDLLSDMAFTQKEVT